MSPLNYGLTPKMKPVAPRRTALIAAVDVGTSKIACLIAKLRPNAQGGAAPAQPCDRGDRLQPHRIRAA